MGRVFNFSAGPAAVPLEVLEHSVSALQYSLQAARDGNPNSVTDAGVAGACGLAAAEGASLNVRINLSGLSSDEAAPIRERHDGAVNEARRLAAEIATAVEEALAE